MADSTNPKDKLGIKKVQLDKVPDTSIIYQALAMEDGALKYGPYNWRETKVSASIYIAAARRHLALWFNGEELTEDTKVPNLGAVLACIGIIIDAQMSGNLVDDRPRPLDADKLNNLLKKVGIGNSLPKQEQPVIMISESSDIKYGTIPGTIAGRCYCQSCKEVRGEK